jgi:hypothetical protein
MFRAYANKSGAARTPNGCISEDEIASVLMRQHNRLSEIFYLSTRAKFREFFFYF